MRDGVAYVQDTRTVAQDNMKYRQTASDIQGKMVAPIRMVLVGNGGTAMRGSGLRSEVRHVSAQGKLRGREREKAGVRCLLVYYCVYMQALVFEPDWLCTLTVFPYVVSRSRPRGVVNDCTWV